MSAELDLTEYAETIEQVEGTWRSTKTSAVSYPSGGTEACFQVEDGSFWFQHRNRCILAALARAKIQQPFFDIGGGNGFVCQAIAKAGYQAVLVEPSREGVSRAVERGLTNVLCSTVGDAAFRPNSMGSLGAFDVIEHIEDDVAFLSELHSYLRPGGHFLLTVPAYSWLWSGDDVYAGHYRRYTVSGMKKTLRSVGFEIDFASYIFSILPLPVFLFRTVPSKLGVKKDLDSPEKHQDDHKVSNSLLHSLLDRIWRWELGRIRTGSPIPFGGSCLVVARKPA